MKLDYFSGIIAFILVPQVVYETFVMANPAPEVAHCFVGPICTRYDAGKKTINFV